MQVVIVLASPRKVALRASASGRYGGRIEHPDKQRHSHVGQLAAVGNLPVVKLLVEEIEYWFRNIKTLFRSIMRGKRVGHRAGTIAGLIRGGGRSLSWFRLVVLSGICLCGMRFTVVEFLPGAGKFRDRQDAGHAQLRSLVFGFNDLFCCRSLSTCRQTYPHPNEPLLKYIHILVHLPEPYNVNIFWDTISSSARSSW